MKHRVKGLFSLCIQRFRCVCNNYVTYKLHSVHSSVPRRGCLSDTRTAKVLPQFQEFAFDCFFNK